MSLCEATNCERQAETAGLCHKHYMRVHRHGSVNGGRNGDGRVKSTHPLWEAWKSMRRIGAQKGGSDPRWADFWVFIDEVGERPDPKARLYRIDRAEPYAKDNVVWKSPLIDVSQLQDNAAYQRAWRIKRPRHSKNAYLKRHYGIGVDQYEAMLEAQGGVCAICGGVESNRHAQTGEVMMLAVDHAHDGTNRIRGLLCTGCNTGLGCFADAPDRLAAAIAYLAQHAVTA